MERTPLLTVVIPTADYHLAIVEEAIQSVLSQTVYCRCIVVYDHEQRGAGWARNRGLEQVNSPFVTFLDSDDLLSPTFAEDMLQAYDGMHYVFCHWLTDRIIEAPCRPWDGSGAAHIVTALYPTSLVRYVGGFDESLPGFEDTDFGWKMTRFGACGRRLAKPLVQYRKGGLRAEAFRQRPDRDAIAKSILERYRGKPMADDCGGCGASYNPDMPVLPANQPFEGAVLATALWAGNRQERGRMTGILYPRSGNGKRLYVHERDIDAAPHLFARVVELPPPLSEDDLQAWRSLTTGLHEGMGIAKAPPVQMPVPANAPRGEVAPDVGQVLRLYQQHT